MMRFCCVFCLIFVLLPGQSVAAEAVLVECKRAGAVPMTFRVYEPMSQYVTVSIGLGASKTAPLVTRQSKVSAARFAIGIDGGAQANGYFVITYSAVTPDKKVRYYEGVAIAKGQLGVTSHSLTVVDNFGDWEVKISGLAGPVSCQ